MKWKKLETEEEEGSEEFPTQAIEPIEEEKRENCIGSSFADLPTSLSGLRICMKQTQKLEAIKFSREHYNIVTYLKHRIVHPYMYRTGLD